jgi:thiol-disulfide isomerase/thioredoxin
MAHCIHSLIFLAALASFSFAAKPSEKLALPPTASAGKELPFFALDVKDGENSYDAVINNDKLKAIAKQRGSKRIIISFFATWCVPCREGLKIMSDNASELEKKGVLVLLANTGEADYAKVDTWIKNYSKEKWLIGFDKYDNFPKTLGMAATSGGEMPLPKTLITNPDLQPLMFIGQEGDDFLKVLLEGL